MHFIVTAALTASSTKTRPSCTQEQPWWRCQWRTRTARSQPRAPHTNILAIRGNPELEKPQGLAHQDSEVAAARPSYKHSSSKRKP